MNNVQDIMISKLVNIILLNVLIKKYSRYCQRLSKIIKIMMF